jgi:hypothetical protein
VEPEDFTMKAPTIEAIMPTAAMASGKRNSSGTMRSDELVAKSALTTIPGRKAARAMGAMIEPA